MAQSNAFAVTVSAPIVQPAWYTPLANQQWTALTAGPAPQLSSVDPCPAGNCSYTGSTGFASVCSAYVGAAASSESLIIAFQGGHHDYAGNGVFEYMFSEDVPRWYRRVDPSTSVQEDVGYYSDGRPSSRHGYKSDCVIPALSGSSNGNRYFAAYGGSTWGSGNFTTNQAASWQRGTSAPDPQSFWPNATPGTLSYDGYLCWDPVTERVWKRDGAYPTYTYTLRSLDPRTKAWTTHGSTVAGSFPDGAYLSALIDPVRRVMVMCYRAQIVVTDLEHPNETGRVYAVSGLPASGNGGFAYEPLSGKWVQWSGGSTIRTITPPANYRSGDGSTSNSLNASASYSAVTVTPGAGATPTSEQGGGTHGRFAYIENPRGFCVVNATNQPVYFFKCATPL